MKIRYDGFARRCARLLACVLVFVLVLLMAGGCVFSNKGEEPEPDPMVIEIGADDTDTDIIPDEPGDDITQNKKDEPDVYNNALIGISLVVAEDWEVVESDVYPDEVLGLNYIGDVGMSIWIDRYPGVDVELFTGGSNDMFTTYKAGLGGEVSEILHEEVLENNSGTWKRTVFILTVNEGDLYIDFYIADMPNDRGVLLFAVITPVFEGELPVYEEALDMFYSLRFTH